MNLLRVYMSAHCLTGSRTRQLLAELAEHQPAVPVEVIDVGDVEAEVPSFIIGTPTFVWNNRVVFLGNPTLAELLARIREAPAHNSRQSDSL
jgi:hypothetical protein